MRGPLYLSISHEDRKETNRQRDMTEAWKMSYIGVYFLSMQCFHYGNI